MKRPKLILAFAMLLALAIIASTRTSESASAPPPGAPAQRSPADLEKLLGPIALYPDSLIATILPASVYPVEIVQAARFVQDPANVAKIDSQAWDDNVKAVAHVPEVIKKMNDELDWTTELGQAFVAQQKEVLNAIQSLRTKAQKSGALKTTEQQVVVVTNTVIQIQPANPQVVYVPTYQPAVVYAPPSPSGPPPVLTFAAGMAMGAIIANNCDWNNGGVYVGGNNVNVNVNRNVNVSGGNTTVNNVGGGQKWQPDQSRLQGSSATRSPESRGWSADDAKPSAQKSSRPPTTATLPSQQPGFNMGSRGAGRGGTSFAGDTAPGGAFSGMNDNVAERSLSERGKASRSTEKKSKR